MGSNPIEALKMFFRLKFAIAYIYIVITTAITTTPFYLYSRSSNQLQYGQKKHFLIDPH